MLKLAVVGIGNYARVHQEAARAMTDMGLAKYVASCTTRPEKYPEQVADLRARGVDICRDYEEILDRHPDLDYIVLPLPIPLHAPLTIDCLRRGVNVLVEKPPAGSIAEVQAMIAAREASGKQVAVGFQWASGNVYLGVRQAIEDGRIGEVKSAYAMGLTQRRDSYYARGEWAGKISLNGEVVRDGTINNPFAHQVMNLMGFAGAGKGRVARAKALEVELYAGHDIESEDTSALRVHTDTGVDVHFYATLCGPEIWKIWWRVEGTKGTIHWAGSYDGGPDATIEYPDGRTETIAEVHGAPHDQQRVHMAFIELLEGKRDRPACALEDTLGFMEIVEGVFAEPKVNHLHGTPHAVRSDDGKPDDPATHIVGIEEYARKAFDTGKLYSELGAPWAGEKVMRRL